MSPRLGRASEVLAAFLRLGCSSFGGPVAHLGYFRAEFVARRGWLDETAFADIVALCQFLPGPASSQVALSIGIVRAGLPGALAAWCGFTLPSALLMTLFAFGVGLLGDPGHAPWLHGLRIVAVAVVARAVWGMARTLCPDRDRATLAAGAAVLVLTLPTAPGQILAVAAGAIAGLAWLRQPVASPSHRARPLLAAPLGIASLLIFGALLFALPLVARITDSHALELVARFYRSGALVFGGGHVVLPLLQQSVVPPGWIGNDRFLAGYGAAQAMPGPLFSFAAYLGAAMHPAPDAWLGAMLCLGAIYLPSFLLLIGVLPFWDSLRRLGNVQAALRGVNAAVVGILLAALYTPIWTSAIMSARDFAFAVVMVLLLAFWRLPPWLVVLVGAISAPLILRAP